MVFHSLLCAQVIEAVLTHGALVQLIRPYSHESWALLRALHETRFLAGIYASQKDQMEHLVEVINLVWVRNASLARENRGPLTYEGCLDVLKKHIGKMFVL